ncbi:MAG: hypothetical protein HY865_22190 [Chloroflexi bacterium]|nr:hypothetical protein [Chloroflexota bacterium]
MQNTIQINTGTVDLAIVRDNNSAGTLSFNPTDTLFAERFYALLGDLQKNLKDYKERGLELGKKGVDEDGVPQNVEEHIALQIELCNYLRDKTDKVFGEGTSQKLFGEVRNLEVYKQFFDGILPYFQQARAEKVARYTTETSAKRNRRKSKK